MIKSFRCNSTFPVKYGESWKVHDGSGRAIEVWTVREVLRNKSGDPYRFEVHIQPCGRWPHD